MITLSKKRVNIKNSQELQQTTKGKKIKTHNSGRTSNLYLRPNCALGAARHELTNQRSGPCADAAITPGASINLARAAILDPGASTSNSMGEAKKRVGRADGQKRTYHDVVDYNIRFNDKKMFTSLFREILSFLGIFQNSSIVSDILNLDTVDILDVII
uniref:Uncharacterized protein n=1 Tax=Romanomermis culicivorax TaxID=13658 RepID=A0A915HXY7_ROMCU